MPLHHIAASGALSLSWRIQPAAGHDARTALVER
jgi:hypothetical protein